MTRRPVRPRCSYRARRRPSRRPPASCTGAMIRESRRTCAIGVDADRRRMAGADRTVLDAIDCVHAHGSAWPRRRLRRRRRRPARRCGRGAGRACRSGRPPQVALDQRPAGPAARPARAPRPAAPRVFIDSLRSDLARRTWPQRLAGQAAAAPGRRPARPGPARTWSARSRGAPSRTATRTRPPRSRTAGTARTAAAAPTAPSPARPGPSRRAGPVAVRPLLDQLDVVVAERPEERLGGLQRAGVVVRLERRGRPGRPPRPAAASIARSSGSVTGCRSASAAPRPSANRDALSSLVASRRPTFIWRSSKARSVPGPAAGRPVAHRVRAVLLQQLHRGDHVALGLGHLLAVRVEDPAGEDRASARAARRARGARAPPRRTARSG